jgi:DNA polymerase III subunit chi
VLVNLGAEVPAALEAFTRVIEIVSTDAADADAGRQRWREYRARGLAVKHHEARGGADG